ncbi:hypothetical protein [Ramlibacter sp.]|uniref:hypothetical protein n=1 Tax=Ramlibacter sp. TaxID=1917967 RepID=UPI00260B06EA|nr:hypothetical protein [Ramlibacter sp.]MDB5956897.1 hypothetical protein [Ramlibacter sp.]
MSLQPLSYLEFDHSDDEEGHGSFDAMAAVDEPRLPALQAEIARVLAWAHALFGAPAHLDEGGEWDCHLDGVRELSTPLAVRYDEAGATIELRDAGTGSPRVTLTLTLTGTAAFCAAFSAAFAGA